MLYRFIDRIKSAVMGLGAKLQVASLTIIALRKRILIWQAFVSKNTKKFKLSNFDINYHADFQSDSQRITALISIPVINE